MGMAEDTAKEINNECTVVVRSKMQPAYVNSSRENHMEIIIMLL